MKAFNIAVLAAKQVWRHPVRSGLTVLGVATGMFLFATVETMHGAMQRATQQQAGDTTLVVYRENRFCPFTSRLPERYLRRIEAIPGVVEAVPIKVVVNNCGTSLDVITFRGVPKGAFEAFAGDRLSVVDGSLADWRARSDAALIGQALARRRGLSPGESFQAANVTVQVAGIIESRDAQDQNVAYVHLDFLQQHARGGLGEVTQFNVRVDDPDRLDEVASAIDAAFADDQEPTHTRPEKAFVAQTAKDLVDIIGFTRWVGLGAILAVVALVANTVLLAVRSRVKEFAVLQTLGYGSSSIAWLVVVEGVVLGAAGGLLGVGSAWAILRYGGWSLSSEGLSIVFAPTMTMVAIGLAAAVLLGLVAGLIPAWRAARQPIVTSLRMA